jgi:hypothetical protein
MQQLQPIYTIKISAAPITQLQYATVAPVHMVFYGKDNNPDRSRCKVPAIRLLRKKKALPAAGMQET